MSHYTCPTCGQIMERDMMLLYKHTNQHIVEEIKKTNPEWVGDNGYCPKCLDYFKGSMSPDQNHDTSMVNISVSGSRKRIIAGIAAAILSVIGWVAIRQGNYSATAYFLLFFPIEASALCFIQAQKKMCVVLGLRGVKDFDSGEIRIENEELKHRFQLLSKKIIAVTSAVSLFICAALFFAGNISL